MLDQNIPLSVPNGKRTDYKNNLKLLTKNSGRMLLIAGDQKIEHLNDDFYGPNISADDNNPEHLFHIAASSEGGVLATHLGLIASYGQNYPNMAYIVKINGKTNLGLNEEKDSSKPLWSVSDVLTFKKQSGLKIAGIGYTLYLGSKYEAKMLKQAAQAIFQAHQAGLLAIIWVYPRGKNIKEDDVHTIAGGSGVVACLGADFVKVKYPYNSKKPKDAAISFKEVTMAAGKTKVICVGGSKQQAKNLINALKMQLDISGSAGLAIGRNLHQRPLAEAIRLAKALGAVIFRNASTAEALNIYLNKDQGSPKIQKKTNKKLLGLF